MADFKNRLLKAMDEKNIKAAELAELTGINKPRISQYVNGLYTPKSKATYLLAKALNVNPSWLMGYDVPMSEKGCSNPDDLSTHSPKFLADEQDLLEDYRKLNEEGKAQVRQYANEKAQLPQYKKSDKNEMAG